MIAKMRMQVGDAVISWGMLPESSAPNARIAEGLDRPKFAVIEGGRSSASFVVDTLPPLRAQSA